VRLAQDADHVGGPGLKAAGAELRDGAASPDDVLAALVDAGEPGQQPLVGLVPVGDQESGEQPRHPCGDVHAPP
jgi:hypothetical protein